MVAQTINLPNTRKMFIPDPGKMLIDVDLERADAQVVAWEAGDEKLKATFREGLDIHIMNAADAFQIPIEKVTKLQRHQSKIGVHAYDYDAKAQTVADNTGMALSEAILFRKNWFGAHPKILDWQGALKEELHSNKGTIRNIFGYEITFFDRLDVKRFHEALAWKPQSVVAIVTNIGLCNIDENLPEVELLMQNHDSLLMQTDISNCPGIYPEIEKQMAIEVPYSDPLIISTGLSVSDKSWGDVEDYPPNG